MTVEIIHGDCLAVMRRMPNASIHCCVTSPPYWGLRDYGVDGQIGIEPTADEYLKKMVEVLREVRRVLRPDGSLWLNMGDSYSTDDKWGGRSGRRNKDHKPRRKMVSGLKPKNMVGMPWRLALALQADGWWLRADIVWHKPNPMPESVTDRPTKAHEYIFLLTKSARYFYDAESTKEPVTGGAHARGHGVNPKSRGTSPATKDAQRDALRMRPAARFGRGPGWRIKQNESFSSAVTELVTTRNMRSVWTIPSHPFRGAHFATFPPALVQRCISAGCLVGGVVLDPFGGAGTTGLVADRLGRNAILVELNPSYCAIAKERLRSYAPLFFGIGS